MDEKKRRNFIHKVGNFLIEKSYHTFKLMIPENADMFSYSVQLLACQIFFMLDDGLTIEQKQEEFERRTRIVIEIQKKLLVGDVELH